MFIFSSLSNTKYYCRLGVCGVPPPPATIIGKPACSKIPPVLAASDNKFPALAQTARLLVHPHKLPVLIIAGPPINSQVLFIEIYLKFW